MKYILTRVYELHIHILYVYIAVANKADLFCVAPCNERLRVYQKLPTAWDTLRHMDLNWFQ